MSNNLVVAWTALSAWALIVTLLLIKSVKRRYDLTAEVVKAKRDADMIERCMIGADRRAIRADNMLKHALGLAHLSLDERAILCAMNNEFAVPYGQLANKTRIPVENVKLSMKLLHRRGFVDFGALHNEDDDLIRGRGYWLSHKGKAIRDKILSRETEPKSLMSRREVAELAERS